MATWCVDSDSPAQTRALGEALGQLLGPSSVVLLSGDLGAGKTCFTQGVGRGLEVPEDEPVVSPSYTLLNLYRGRLDLYHFDLYRLAHPEDLIDLGFDEYLCGDGVTVVEWGDRFPELGLEGILVRLEHGEDEHRQIRITVEGAAGELLIEALQRSWKNRGRTP